MGDNEKNVFINNKSYISVVRAADLTGYHGDYIGRLCRERKIDGIKIGNNWLVSEEDILNLASKNGSKKKLVRNSINEGENIAPPILKIPVINNTYDEWDKALFNNLPVERPSKNLSADEIGRKNIAPPSFLSRYNVFFIFIILIGFFFYRHPESIYANFKDFKNFSNQFSNQVSRLFKHTDQQVRIFASQSSSLILTAKDSIQTSAILAAASIQETAFNLISKLEELKLENLENRLLNSGKFVGWRLSQKKDILSEAKAGLKESLTPVLSPIKSAKTAFFKAYFKNSRECRKSSRSKNHSLPNLKLRKP
jgi:hypothetical protein